MLQYLANLFLREETSENWHHESLAYFERDRHTHSIDPNYFSHAVSSSAVSIKREDPDASDNNAVSLGLADSGHRESRARAASAGLEEAEDHPCGPPGARLPAWSLLAPNSRYNAADRLREALADTLRAGCEGINTLRTRQP